MNSDIQTKLDKYDVDLKTLFKSVENIVFEAAPLAEQKMWAGLPSYYVNEKFVRLIPFKNYINIEAKGILQHVSQLHQFKTTPKGMLQIYTHQQTPYQTLKTIFSETLN